MSFPNVGSALSRTSETAERRSDAQSRAVSDLSTSSCILEGDVKAVARQLTEVAAKVAGVARANVWLFSDAEDELHCIDLYEAATDRHSSGMVRREQEFQNEFQALKQAPYVDANEPLADPRTRGYVERYLRPLGITAMLSTVVEISGKHIGLLCLEHVGRPHRWTGDEIAFAARLGDKIAVTLSLRLARQAAAEARTLARFPHETPNAVMRLAADGRVLYANPAAVSLKTVCGGAGVGELVNGRMLDLLRQCMTSGRTREVEMQDGPQYFSIQMTLIAAEGYANVYGKDITLRKQAEAALVASRDLFASVVENVPARVFWKDANLRFLGCNSLFARDAGFTDSGDLAGKDDFQMPWRAQADLYRADDRSVLDSGKANLGIEEQQTTPDGRAIWLRTSKVPWRGVDGQTIGILGMYDDITEHKRAQEDLRQSEERFRGYFEHGLIGMAVTLPDKSISEVNGKFCEIFGYPREELLRMDWASLTHPDDLAADVTSFDRVLNGDIDSYGLDKRFIRKGGATAYCTISISCVRRADRSVDYIIALIEDITERKLAEQTLHTALTSTVEAIAATIEARDPYTAGHQRSVADLAAAIAREMGLPADRIEGIHFGALIHDLGKIQVPAELLSKPTRLSTLEMALVRTHPQAGYDIVKEIKFPWPVADMIHQHHERLDGTGYPLGLSGDAITLEARIIAVADAVESMASHRPYRPGLGIDRALQEIQDRRGTWFEPAAVDACVRLFREKDFEIKKGTFG